MRTLHALAIILICVTGVRAFEPEDGDLLFQDLDCGPLCDAIEEVTPGYGGANFSHVGMVVLSDSGTLVLEAVSKGVILTPLDEFLARSSDQNGNPKVLVGRVKPVYSDLIPDARAEAFEFLGAEYDEVFLMNNNEYYCSELLYISFKKASGDENFFRVQAMTFKPQDSEEFFPAWEEYYAGMGIPIPEGQPGLNPGSISLSDKIDIVYAYGIPSGYNVQKSE